jgi:hypothetical protein
MSFTDQEKTASAQLATHETNGITPVSSTHVDDNYELYKSVRDVEIDPAEAKSVLRKIDERILPILFMTYMLQYLDKNTINFASVYGLQKGTGLVGNDYSWLGKSIIFNYNLQQLLTLACLRFYFLLWLPILPIPFWVLSSAAKDWEISFDRDHHLGNYPHHDTSMYQLRWYFSKPLPARRCRSHSQPRIRFNHVHVVHFRRAASSA